MIAWRRAPSTGALSVFAMLGASLAAGAPERGLAERRASAREYELQHRTLICGREVGEALGIADGRVPHGPGEAGVEDGVPEGAGESAGCSAVATRRTPAGIPEAGRFPAAEAQGEGGSKVDRGYRTTNGPSGEGMVRSGSGPLSETASPRMETRRASDQGALLDALACPVSRLLVPERLHAAEWLAPRLLATRRLDGLHDHHHWCEVVAHHCLR